MPDSLGADRIPARNDHEAWDRFERILTPALRSVSPNAIWFQSRPPGYAGRDARAAVTIPPAIELTRRDGEKLFLRSAILITFEDDSRHVGERKVKTLQYNHAISLREDSGTWFRWEWHPESSAEPNTHLHVYAPLAEHWPAGTRGLERLHLTTSRVFFEQVVQFAVRELDVAVVSDDHYAQVPDARHRAERHSSWTGPGPRPTVG